MSKAKYHQIKMHITAKIEQGLWPAHQRLPSENEFATQFNCSRMTARRAVTELCEAGVLVRSQGLGTFVSELKSQSSMMAIRNIADEIMQRGHGYSVTQLQLQRIPADAATAIALGLEEGVSVFFSLLVHAEQGEPIQLEERYVNPLLIPEYLQQDFQSQTPHEYLSRIAPLTQAQHTVEAVTASPRQQQQLAIAPTEPCLLITRRTWSSQGAVSFARLLHPGSRFRLGGQIQI